MDNKFVKHHTKIATVMIIIIFVAAAVAWMYKGSIGLALLILGGVVFGITYKKDAYGQSEDKEEIS